MVQQECANGRHQETHTKVSGRRATKGTGGVVEEHTAGRCKDAKAPHSQHSGPAESRKKSCTALQGLYKVRGSLKGRRGLVEMPRSGISKKQA